MSVRLLLVAVALLLSACADAADTDLADAEASVAFVLRPVGFQNDKADLYTEAAKRCLALPWVTGGPATSATPPFYRLSAVGDHVARLRACVTGLGADVEEVAGRPGEQRGRAAYVDKWIDDSVVLWAGYF